MEKMGKETIEERRALSRKGESRCEPILTKTLEWEHLLMVEPLRASNNAKLSVVCATPSLSRSLRR